MTNASSPVVFVHGLIGTLQVPDIVQYFRAGSALAPDLLGYGSLRDVPPSQIDIRAQVDHLRRTVSEHFGAEPIHAVGHSVGGLIVMLFADAYPERVKSIVNVEGNFTLKDAFWSAALARMTEAEAERVLSGFRADPAGWLRDSGIAADADVVGFASEWLHRQPAATLRAISHSIVAESSSPEYLAKVRSVFSRHPVHLVAGERSSGDWDVPDWARRQAASSTIIPATGHLMMLERPARFAAVVQELVQELVHESDPRIEAV